MNLKIISAENYIRPTIKNSTKIRSVVSDILNDVQLNGDSAINCWSKQIDGFTPNFIPLKPFDEYAINQKQAQAIQFAHSRIKRFAQFQMESLQSRSFKDEFGEFGIQVQPLERMGAYIPAGNYPLISSALMTLTPAKVAGCKELIACSPSDNPYILAAASLAGATHFLKIGGAQAVAALSYGYQKIKAVDIIVGPGNAYVNEAKSQIMNRTKIDSLAGPSEVLIYANQLKNPEWIFYDALAQSEHDINAKSLIVSTNISLLKQMKRMLEESDESLPLIQNQQIELIKAKNESAAIKFINDYAPEHIMVCENNVDQNMLKNYGALFLGENSAVAFGDYCSGPNHTLPTSGNAKQNGGLGVQNFVRILTQQSIFSQNINKLKENAKILSELENLRYHTKSIMIRT